MRTWVGGVTVMQEIPSVRRPFFSRSWPRDINKASSSHLVFYGALTLAVQWNIVWNIKLDYVFLTGMCFQSLTPHNMSVWNSFLTHCCENLVTFFIPHAIYFTIYQLTICLFETCVSIKISPRVNGPFLSLPRIRSLASSASFTPPFLPSLPNFPAHSARRLSSNCACVHFLQFDRYVQWYWDGGTVFGNVSQ